MLSAYDCPKLALSIVSLLQRGQTHRTTVGRILHRYEPLFGEDKRFLYSGTSISSPFLLYVTLCKMPILISLFSIACDLATISKSELQGRIVSV